MLDESTILRTVDAIPNSIMHGDRRVLEVFGIEKIFVGVEDPTKQVIVKGTDGGNHKINDTKAVCLGDRNKVKRKNAFMLDLETGSRGGCPGAKVYGQISGKFKIYSEPREDSQILLEAESAEVRLPELYRPQLPPKTEGCLIKYSNIQGYVKAELITILYYDK